MAKHDLQSAPASATSVTGTAVTLRGAVGDDVLAKKYAEALVPMSASNKTAQRIAAYTRLLETPFVSGRAAAETETIVTVMGIAPGVIADMNDPNVMIEQHLFLCKLQTPLTYKDSGGKEHDHAIGDEVIVGLRRSKVRDTFVDIMQEEVNNGAVLPNLMLVQVASKKPGFAPATTFRQLFPEPK